LNRDKAGLMYGSTEPRRCSPGNGGESRSQGTRGKNGRGSLSPKTVNTYSQVVKSVVASAVNEEGEQLFPRKWNHEFVDMPVVDKSKQNTPHFTSEVIAGILKSSKGYKQMFCACLVERDSALEKQSALKSTSTSQGFQNTLLSPESPENEVRALSQDRCGT
jgi:hypothetical protein